jgi:hypothetical protein
MEVWKYLLREGHMLCIWLRVNLISNALIGKLTKGISSVGHGSRCERYAAEILWTLPSIANYALNQDIPRPGESEYP